MAEGMGKAIDRGMFGRGLTRAPLSTFILRLIPWFALLGFGLYAVYLMASGQRRRGGPVVAAGGDRAPSEGAHSPNSRCRPG